MAKKTKKPLEQKAHDMADCLVEVVRDEFRKEFAMVGKMKDELSNTARILDWVAKILEMKGNPHAEQVKHRAMMCRLMKALDQDLYNQIDWEDMDRVEREMTLKRLHLGFGWDDEKKQDLGRKKINRSGQYEMEI